MHTSRWYCAFSHKIKSYLILILDVVSWQIQLHLFVSSNWHIFVVGLMPLNYVWIHTKRSKYKQCEWQCCLYVMFTHLQWVDVVTGTPKKSMFQVSFIQNSVLPVNLLVFVFYKLSLDYLLFSWSLNWFQDVTVIDSDLFTFKNFGEIRACQK